MSAATLDRVVHHDEGVVTRRLEDGLHIELPHATSPRHRLRIIAVLWREWVTSRSEPGDEGLEWTIWMSETEEMTLPLASILGAIGAELRQGGRKLVVLGGATHSPSLNASNS